MTGVSPPDGKDNWGNPTKLVTRWRDAPMSASGHQENYWLSTLLCHTTRTNKKTWTLTQKGSRLVHANDKTQRYSVN